MAANSICDGVRCFETVACRFQARTVFVCAVLLLGSTVCAERQSHKWSIDPDGSIEAAQDRETGVVILLCDEEYGADWLSDQSLFSGENGRVPEYVRLDWPGDPRLDVAASQLFLAWADRYEVRHLPSVLLLDSSGRVYSRLPVETLEGGDLPAAIKSAFAVKSERDFAMAEADGLSGTPRAIALDRALKTVSEFVLTDYRSVAEEIVILDTDGGAGLSTQYRAILQSQDLDELIQGTIYPLIDQGDYGQARQALDGVLAAWPLSSDDRQLIIGFQAQLFYSEGDRVAALELIDEAIALSPASAASEKLRIARSQIASLPLPE